MSSKPHQLHIVFFPFMAPGHMIPALDIARLFASRNVRATIITTPLNVSIFTNAIEKSNKIEAPMINIEVFRFPAQEAGLPEGCENTDRAFAAGLINQFHKAAEMLKEQLEQYLEKIRPSCLVVDMFFPWTLDSTAKFNIPNIAFQVTSYFSLCVQEIVRLHEAEPSVLPSLPHGVEITRFLIQESLQQNEDNEDKKRMKLIKESELKCYGVIVNSFYELEPDYADFFRKELGRRAWHIGPVSMCNKSTKDKAQRGKQASINEHECLKWLDSKKADSIIYICFGSTAPLIAPQLHEIAMALEASGREFIWVVRNNDSKKTEEYWMPPRFEQRMEGKGLIIRGWAPQMLIMEHEAIGAFVTHCGWNSTLEAISAGVPMVTWPFIAEQFYNQNLVTRILKIGIPVGANHWGKVPSIENLVKRDLIEKALRDIMVGEETLQRRTRAKQLKQMARKAVEEEGSAYSDLSALIDELLRGYN